MKSALIVLVSLLGSVSFAAECTAGLQLTCQADYYANGVKIASDIKTDALVDENWDEPSLANCAATAYFSLVPQTTVRVRAQKDLQSNSVAMDSVGVQTYEYKKDGQVYRDADYSNYISAQTTVGQVAQIGSIRLPKAITVGQSVVTDVAVSCVVK